MENCFNQARSVKPTVTHDEGVELLHFEQLISYHVLAQLGGIKLLRSNKCLDPKLCCLKNTSLPAYMRDLEAQFSSWQCEIINGIGGIRLQPDRIS